MRGAVGLLLAGQAAYWLLVMGYGYAYATPGDGGLQWLPGLFATPPFVVMTLPSLLCAIRGRWTAALVFALAGTAAVPLLVWTDLAETIAGSRSLP